MEKTRNSSRHYLITPKWMFRTERHSAVHWRPIILHAKSDQNDMPSKHKIPKVDRENPITLKNTDYRQSLQTYTGHSTSAWQWFPNLWVATRQCHTEGSQYWFFCYRKSTEKQLTPNQAKLWSSEYSDVKLCSKKWNKSKQQN